MPDIVEIEQIVFHGLVEYFGIRVLDRRDDFVIRARVFSLLEACVGRGLGGNDIRIEIFYRDGFAVSVDFDQGAYFVVITVPIRRDQRDPGGLEEEFFNRAEG